jgi:hypothetical protein
MEGLMPAPTAHLRSGTEMARHPGLMETTTALGEGCVVDLAEQGVEFGAVEGLALGCALELHEALDLHKAAGAGADDVQVGLGLDVFLVVELGQEHATDDADADQGDRAGEWLGLGPDGVPHDRSAGC